MTSMVKNTFIYGYSLITLALAFYVYMDGTQFTALIPAIIGLLVIASGLIARDDKRRKAGMHIAVVISLVAFLATAKSLPKLLALLAGQDVLRPLAVLEQSLAASFSLVYLVLAICSFIEARKAK